MPNSERPRVVASGWFARRWAWAPVVLLGSLLGTQLVVLSQVLDDPGFAVEPGYYQKAVGWDESRRQQVQCEELGWTVGLQLDPDGEGHWEPHAVSSRASLGQPGGTAALVLRVKVRDRDGRALPEGSLSVEAFANGRADARVSRSLRPNGSGLYEALMPVHRAGLWVFRVRVRQQAHDCQYSFRRDIPRLVSAVPVSGQRGQQAGAPWN